MFSWPGRCSQLAWHAHECHRACRLSKQLPSLTSKKANAPAPASRPVFTQPPKRSVEPTCMQVCSTAGCARVCDHWVLDAVLSTLGSHHALATVLCQQERADAGATVAGGVWVDVRSHRRRLRCRATQASLRRAQRTIEPQIYALSEHIWSKTCITSDLLHSRWP